ncbi:MAG: hypothetical protein L0Z53_07695 [Acidobacteriales bacterium]|nr:hypothetical protein [Terriglobales bacterium]
MKTNSGRSKFSQATPTDAQLIMQLYDLRREPELRKARDWCTQTFFPASVDDIMAVFQARGTDHNRWLRQFITYYEMAASFVNRGAVNRDLLEDSVTEYINFYAKVRPFLKELRAKIGWPHFMQHIEMLAESSPRGRELTKTMLRWFEERRAREAKAAAQK